MGDLRPNPLLDPPEEVLVQYVAGLRHQLLHAGEGTGRGREPGGRGDLPAPLLAVLQVELLLLLLRVLPLAGDLTLGACMLLVLVGTVPLVAFDSHDGAVGGTQATPAGTRSCTTLGGGVAL